MLKMVIAPPAFLTKRQVLKSDWLKSQLTDNTRFVKVHQTIDGLFYVELETKDK